MAHIPLSSSMPGIIGLMDTYPETAKPLLDLAESLLVNRASPTFSKADRETVAAYVSFLNGCLFCSESHAAAADYHWVKSGKSGLSKQVWENLDQAPISDRLKSLLKIAAKVQKSAKEVEKQDVVNAMSHGAAEQDVHDTVLIAAAFCLYNRYVDGLGTFAPPRGDPSYVEAGKRLGTQGYLKPN